MQDLLKEFLDPDIMNCQIKIIMVDFQGKAEKGFRDAIANFWQEFYLSCCLGERGRVPFLRHDFQADEWKAVSRIIVRGYLDLGYFRVMVSQAFVICAMFGEKAVPDEIILRSFKRYLAPMDEQLVCRALASDFKECEDDNQENKDEDLTDLLDRFGCRKLATPILTMAS